MARERPQKTLADYVAIAISPALIMVLVGSLAYFLLEVTYDGRYAGRIRWVLFWFVFASVLVGRIGIEQGRQYATGYWVAIGLAGAAVVFRLLETYQLGALALLGVIMWCSNKLTWDCTLIDDSQDASGEGLLQVSGFDETTDQQAAAASDGAAGQNRPAAAADAATADAAAESPPAIPFWKRLFLNLGEQEGRPHAPGLWVVYFSLLALPLFGIGQLLIPVESGDSRQWGFKLLVVYVAAALGLLLTTSFLGLRRYLRQRKLTMPVRMTAAWLATGAAMVALLLAVCLVLPRPGSTTSITDAIEQVASKARDASKFAFLKDDAGENEGTPTGKPADDQDASQQPDSGGQAGRGGKQAGQSDDRDKPAERDGRSDTEGQKSGAGEAQGKDGSGASSQDANGESERQNDQGRQQSGQGESQKQSSQAGGEQQSRQAGDEQKSQPGQRPSGQSERERQAGQDQGRNPSEPGNEQEQQGQDGGAQSDRQQQQQQQQQQGSSGGPQKESERSEQSSEPESTSTATEAPQPADWVGWLVKVILYLILAAVALYFIVRHWRTIVATLGRMWDELRNLFASLFGGRKVKSAAGGRVDDLLAPVPPRPFASFNNPFFTGAAGRMSPEELVIYTFRALEAWGYDNNFQRRPDQTPLEYAGELGGRFPEVAGAARTVSRLFTRVAYAERAPTDRCREMLEPVWRKLTDTARRPAMAT
ncbi:MAG TPA: DUF4129 domain-containing protein [Planctomycetaceae bacterium]|nr:DUF4129 domain-containing protein [Planctomycetaceae bacterium]